MEARTVKIQGQEVHLLYCAATENGFEELRGKSIHDLDFNLQQDLIVLGLCAIVSYYSRKGEDSPVTSETLLYDATAQELIELVKTVAEMRAEWYGVPAVIKQDETADGEDNRKN